MAFHHNLIPAIDGLSIKSADSTGFGKDYV